VRDLLAKRVCGATREPAATREVAELVLPAALHARRAGDAELVDPEDGNFFIPYDDVEGWEHVVLGMDPDNPGDDAPGVRVEFSQRHPPSA
jgi:hypothetical protein